MANTFNLHGQKWSLPKGFSSKDTRVGEVYYDERGFECVMYTLGYTSAVGDRQPYLQTNAQSGGRRVPFIKGC